jgi:succinate-semialdehyde dehydrogenase/glutarate-semialdehyde dehydrogenase
VITTPGITRPSNADAIVSKLLPLVKSTSDATALVTSPLDGQTVCNIPVSNAQDVTDAFKIAKAAFSTWHETNISTRISYINNFHDLLLKNSETILDIVQWENGKTRSSGMDEILDIALTCQYYAKVSKKLLKPKSRLGAFPVVTVVKELHHPLGVVGVISPWNYPLTLAVSDFIPALIAGNTVVIKPDLQTPLSALVLIDLLYQAGIPGEVIQVVMGEGAEIGPQIVAQSDFVMFTGSTRVGREVAASAGARLIPASMELGGKNSLIIDKTVDIPKAVEIAVRGAFANSGQLCIGTERIVVHESVYDEFLAAFVAAVSQMKLGSEIGWGFDMGTLINERQITNAEKQIADAVSKGAKVEVGGKRRPEIGPFVFEPTVLSEVSNEADICSIETFGPVCSVYKWHYDEDLVEFVNNTDYGLSAGIVSKNISWANRIAGRLHVGGVNINEAFASAYASIDAPMGGMKQSGVGRRHGVAGLLKYTESQTIARQRWMKLGPQWGMNDKGWASFAKRMVRILRTKDFK